jgi:hypothetical protein
VSHLSSVGADALRRNTKIDWPKIVPEYLADFDAIEREIEATPIPEERKQIYRDYISECRSVWEKMALLPVPAEGHLGFRKEVQSRFRFLEAGYNFQVTQATPIMVRYESPYSYVELYYSPNCPAIAFQLGRLPQPKEGEVWFSLDDIAYWADLGLQFDYSQFDLESRQGIRDFVASAAGIIQHHADPVLRNNASAWESLAAKQVRREQLLASEGGAHT